MNLWNVLVNLMTICVLTSDVLMAIAASREELGGSQDMGSGRQVSFIGASFKTLAVRRGSEPPPTQNNGGTSAGPLLYCRTSFRWIANMDYFDQF